MTIVLQYLGNRTSTEWPGAKKRKYVLSTCWGIQLLMVMMM
jgi:hypothetical protein